MLVDETQYFEIGFAHRLGNGGRLGSRGRWQVGDLGGFDDKLLDLKVREISSREALDQVPEPVEACLEVPLYDSGEGQPEKAANDIEPVIGLVAPG